MLVLSGSSNKIANATSELAALLKHVHNPQAFGGLPLRIEDGQVCLTETYRCTPPMLNSGLALNVADATVRFDNEVGAIDCSVSPGAETSVEQATIAAAEACMTSLSSRKAVSVRGEALHAHLNAATTKSELEASVLANSADATRDNARIAHTSVCAGSNPLVKLCRRMQSCG